MAKKANKITDLIEPLEKFSFSFEVTPDVTQDDLDRLDVEPIFYSVTWHAKYHKCKDLDIGPLKTSNLLKSKNKEVLLHLSCDMMRKNYLDQLMNDLQEKGICNLFVVLGESFDSSTSDFKTSVELIRYIRDKTGNYFCIGIPGFPDSTEEKLLQIKEKIDSGANFIVTQAFFETNPFKKFIVGCNKVGINVPIIPGIFLFENYNQLNIFIKMCKVKVSEEIIEKVKNRDETDLKLCFDIVKNVISVLSADCQINHFHFFTLNKLTNVSSFIKQLQ